MSVSDSISVSHLLHDESSSPIQFSSKQLESLTANPNGYQRTIDFDTLPLTGRWCTFEDAWLSLPVRITGTTAGASADFDSASPAIAFKGSVLSLIDGISVQTSSGVSLVEERHSTVFANHLRLMLEKPSNWFISNGDSLEYAKDQPAADVVSALTAVANIQDPQMAKYTGAVSATANSDNLSYNQGFAIRSAKLLSTATSVAAAGVSQVLNIKLSAIASFFEAMNFPFVNCRMKLTFYMNFTTSANSSYLPMCRGTDIATGAVVAADIPYLAFDTASGDVPRIYYHSLLFSPEQSAAISSQLEKGFVKKLRYSVYDMYTTPGVTNPTISAPISTNVVNPKRVFALAQPTGLVNGVRWPSPLVTGADSYLTNVNVLVNNQVYLQSSLSTPAAQYEQLREAMPLHAFGGSDTDLKYSDWLNTYRIVCVDLSRHGDQSGNKNLPISLTFTGTLMGVMNADLTYIVERQMQTLFEFGAADFVVKTGPALFH